LGLVVREGYAPTVRVSRVQRSAAAAGRRGAYGDDCAGRAKVEGGF